MWGEPALNAGPRPGDLPERTPLAAHCFVHQEVWPVADLELLARAGKLHFDFELATEAAPRAESPWGVSVRVLPRDIVRIYLHGRRDVCRGTIDRS